MNGTNWPTVSFLIEFLKKLINRLSFWALFSGAVPLFWRMSRLKYLMSHFLRLFALKMFLILVFCVLSKLKSRHALLFDQKTDSQPTYRPNFKYNSLIKLFDRIFKLLFNPFLRKIQQKFWSIKFFIFVSFNPSWHLI
jgi:hypothetical protein